MQKKIMILGAGYNQVYAIQKAVGMGYYVITTDYLPDNVGHRYSHQYVNCSTVDKEGILKVVEDLQVDGVMTIASDVATPTVAYVVEKLGRRPGMIKSVETMVNKGHFRRFQEDFHLGPPGFEVVMDVHMLANAMARLKPPLIFKPVDTSGSRGVGKLDKVDGDNYYHLFEDARMYSRSGRVCIESFVEGVEVGGDCFVQDGTVAFLAITRKRKRDFVVTGHSLPTDIPPQTQDLIQRTLNRYVRLLNYESGPVNFDIIIPEENENDIFVLEMSPRLGGNGIPLLIRYGMGVDLVEATIQDAMNETFALPAPYDTVKPCGSLVLGARNSGVIKHMTSETQLREALPELFYVILGKNTGDTVETFAHGGNSLGFAAFGLDGGKNYDEMAGEIYNLLQLTVA